MSDDTTGGVLLYVEDSPADELVLGLELPDMHGLVVLRALPAEPRTQAIPAAGARDFPTKPLDVRQLLALEDETMKGERPWGSSIR
jgi:DNA-binding response OmpR family regulator